MKKITLVLVLLFGIGSRGQNVREFTLEYDGYNLQINSIAKDGKGNIVVAATARFKNDPTLSAAQNKDANYDVDKTSLILITDENFTIRKAWKHYNFFPAKVTYDSAKEQFWIGGSQQEYDSKRPKLFSQWQMLLLRADAKKLTRDFFPVETEYSCHMEDLVLHDKKLVCTATKDTLDGKSRLETALVFELSPAKFHSAKYQPHLESPNVLNVAKASQSASHVMLTSVDLTKDKLLFGATSLPFGHFPTQSIDLYNYAKGQLHSEKFWPAAKTSSFYYLTNFEVLTDGNLLLAYVTHPEKEFYIIEKTDPYLQSVWKKEVPDLRNAYLNNDVFEMPDGKIVAAVANKNKDWSFFIYSPSGELLREIETKQPINSRIALIKPWTENEFLCSFYALDKKPMPNRLLIFKTE